MEKQTILTKDGVNYALRGDGTAEVVKSREARGHVVIPETVEGCPVVRIQDDAFLYSRLESVEIPGTVETIGPGAFSQSSLRSVRLQTGLKHIEQSAFCSTKITEIFLPDGLKTIGKYALGGCDLLMDVRIPASVEEIAFDAFTFSGIKEVFDPEATREQAELASAAAGYTSRRAMEMDHGSYRADAMESAALAVAYGYGNVYRKVCCLKVTAPAGSYADQWCREHNFSCVRESC